MQDAVYASVYVDDFAFCVSCELSRISRSDQFLTLFCDYWRSALLRAICGFELIFGQNSPATASPTPHRAMLGELEHFIRGTLLWICRGNAWA
jgi:hypothetical protein